MAKNVNGESHEKCVSKLMNANSETGPSATCDLSAICFKRGGSTHDGKP